MKIYQIVLTLIALLALNDLALLTFIGHFAESESGLTESTKLESVSAITSHEIGIHETPSSIENRAPEATQSQTHTELAQAIDSYVSSDQFTAALDNWQFESIRRGEEIELRLATMDSQELYSLTYEAESGTERVMALHLLIGTDKVKLLSNEQLISLHSSEEGGQWSKMSLLKVLLKRDAPYAIDIAKQSISNNPLARGYLNTEVYNAIYEKDPEFIKRHIAESKFSEISANYNLLSFMRQDRDLAGAYLSQNFDQILNSNSDHVFMLGVNDANIKMTQQQQSKIAELFSSTNKHKRNFAIGLARNIENTQTLREAYAELKKRGERTQFLAGLLYPEVNSEVTALVREIASHSDDPNIRRLQTPN